MKLLKGLILAALLITSPAFAQTIIPGAGSSLATPVIPANGGSGVANTGNLTWNAAQTLSFTSGQTMTFPATSATLARTDAAQTFTGVQTFSTPIAVGSGGSGVANTGNLTWNAAQTLSFTSGQTMTFPAASTTVAGLGTAQTFTGVQTFSPTAVASPAAVTWSPTPSVVSGATNIAGANFTVSASQGTGTGAGGSLIFQVAPAGSTGSSQNALATALTIDSTKLATFAGGATFGGTVVVNALTSGNAVTAGSTGAVSFNGRAQFRSPAANVLQFGPADAAAPVGQTLQFQNVVGGTSNTAGVNTTINLSQGTGTGVGGNLTINSAPHSTTGSTQNALVPALTINGDTLAVQMPGLASSSSAQTGTVCWTTGTGNLTIDTTTTCLLSDMRLKKNMVPLNDNEGLPEVMALKPFSYDLKDDPMHVGRQVGLGAQQVAKVDPRLVAIYDRGPNIGTPKGVRYEQLTAVLVKAVQQQQAEIDGLRREIRQLKGSR